MKKILTALVLVLTFAFSTQALASLTFTTNAITGTTASTIDLGSGNDLFLQTTGRNVSIGTATTLGSKLSIDASGANTTPLIIKTNGSVGNYTPANSAIFIKDAAGTEMLRIFASDPDGDNNYNGDNLYVGRLAGFSQPTDNVNAGYWNTGVGGRALNAITTGVNNSAYGSVSLLKNTTGQGNSAFGVSSMYQNLTGSFNTSIGNTALYENTTGNNNTAVGIGALSGNQTGSGNVALGYLAGRYETGSNAFYVDNQSRGNTAGDKAGAILYGQFNATPANQILTVNGNLGISTTAPSQKLEVNGGIRLNTVTAKPTCDATTRGTIWYVAGGTGVADTGEMCRKDVADAYAWVTIY